MKSLACSLLSTLDVDDPLRRQLVSQKDAAFANHSHETAGVARDFLSRARTPLMFGFPAQGPQAMSNDRSTFLILKSDRSAIRLADGKVIYSSGLGSTRFLSDCGYLVTIHHVLFVPLLAVDLFASNRFAKDYRDTHSETTEYPECGWINHRAAAVEFTATIQSSNLAHLNWKVAPRFESANLSITKSTCDLITCRFGRQRDSVNGLPVRVTGTLPMTSVEIASTD